MDKAVYTMSEVGQMFGVSRMTVYNWVKSGKITSIKLGNKTYVLKAELNRMLNINN